jgi:hypothetical protein
MDFLFKNGYIYKILYFNIKNNSVYKKDVYSLMCKHRLNYDLIFNLSYHRFDCKYFFSSAFNIFKDDNLSLFFSNNTYFDETTFILIIKKVDKKSIINLIYYLKENYNTIFINYLIDYFDLKKDEIVESLI